MVVRKADYRIPSIKIPSAPRRYERLGSAFLCSAARKQYQNNNAGTALQLRSK